MSLLIEPVAIGTLVVGILAMIFNCFFMLTVPFWQKVGFLHKDNKRIRISEIMLFIVALFLIIYSLLLLTYFGK